MLDKWVLDIETKNFFDDVGGKNNIHKLEISVIGLYSYQKNEYLSFDENEFEKFSGLLPSAGAIIGFALDRFDLPVLRAHFPDFPPILSYDILEEVEKQTGRRVKLESLATENISVGKSGTGAGAIDLYKEGKMEELKAYCLQDVKVTKELYEFGMKNGHIQIPKYYSFAAKVDLPWRDMDEKIVALEKERQNIQNQTRLF